MATTTGGTTYVTSTDLVANYPTASLALANRVDVVASGSMSKKTASYTVTVADILAGTTIAMNSASATVITLPSTSLVNGMILKVFSVNTGAVTFTGGTVTGTTTSITAQYSGLTLTYDSAAAVWWSLPFAGGSAKATVSSTTGSPTITTVGSKTIYKYTGAGSITFATAGQVEILVVGGAMGGQGANVGGGSGGGVVHDTLTVTATSYSVAVGAGSAWNANATSSTFGTEFAGGALTTAVNTVPAGGGGGLAASAGGFGGGGARGAGDATNGGAGYASTIAGGGSVTYGSGGAKASGGAGTANTGQGGGGNSSGTGPSGVVIVSVG